MRIILGDCVRNLSVKVSALMMILSCLMGTACARNPHRVEDIHQKIESLGQIPDFLAMPEEGLRKELLEEISDRILEKPSSEEKNADLYWRAYLATEELPLWFALIPQAVSKGDCRYEDSYSVGLWGLTEAVALRYGLFIADNYDERRDPEKATAAACAYWNRLRQQYASEGDALMAFVNTPLLYNNLKRAYGFPAENPLWEGYGLKEWLRPDFPVEILRAVYWNSESLGCPAGLPSNSLSRSVASRADSMECASGDNVLCLKVDIPLDSLCRILSLSKERFLSLNPAVGPGKVLPSGAELHLPEPMTSDSVEMELRESARLWKASVTAALEKARKQAAAPRIYTIRQGDSLGLIARRFKVSVSDLKRWNRLKSDRILAGKTLKIYTK